MIKPKYKPKKYPKIKPKPKPYSPTPKMRFGADIKNTFNQFMAGIGGKPLTAIPLSKISGKSNSSPSKASKMSQAAIESLNKKSKKSKPAPPVKDAAAEKRAKIKEEGRKRRIKFEKKQGEKAKKRRALLLNIEKAKK